jgi:hypothetical protein
LTSIPAPLLLRCALAIAGLTVTPARLDAQWLVSAYGGAVHTQAADVQVDQPAMGTTLVFPDTAFESRSFELPLYYGARIAHSVPRFRWLFVEAELIHGKLYLASPQRARGGGVLQNAGASDVPFAAVVEDFNLSHGFNFILFNALMRRAVYADRVTATARIGAGPLLPHAESVAGGQRREAYELAGIGVQLSGGAEVAVWRRLAVTAEYKWTRAQPHVTLAVGSLQLTAISHHLAVGLSAHF